MIHTVILFIEKLFVFLMILNDVLCPRRPLSPTSLSPSVLHSTVLRLLLYGPFSSSSFIFLLFSFFTVESEEKKTFPDFCKVKCCHVQ